MVGQVLEITSDQPDLAIPVLRRLGTFEEVALYGAQIHVVTQEPEAHRPLIEQALHDAGVRVTAVDHIAPSLEDVFIASAHRQERHWQMEQVRNISLS